MLEYQPEVDVTPVTGTYATSSECTVAPFRFVNIRFTVEDGASLVFDMPTTQFGPNDGVREALGENATS